MRSVAKCCVIVLCLTLVDYTCGEDPVPTCPCDKASQCDPVTKWDDHSREVIIMTNHTSSYSKWLWDSITTVVSMTDHPETDLMCFAHSKGVKYGIKKDIIQNYNYMTQDVTDSINVIKQEITITRADVLMLDLMPLLGNCNNAKEHVEYINNVTKRVITEVKGSGQLRVICVVPWKPPCYDSECMVGPLLAKVCDAIEVNPDSFLTYCNDACIARATVPFSRMQMGLMEYEAVGFKPEQILLALPWHGYNYTCDKLFTVNSTTARNVCTLKRQVTDDSLNSSGSTCMYEESRTRLSLEQINTDHIGALVVDNGLYNVVDQAPYQIYKKNVTVDNKTVETGYMAWFEDVASLHTKYQLVTQYGFRGVVVYTGDDLTYTNVQDKSIDDRMWAWVLHTIFSTGKVSFNNDEPDYAGIVAGVGVGMFVFGCLLGVLFACIYFRRNKKLKAPFQRDTRGGDMADEYHDDDLNL